MDGGHEIRQLKWIWVLYFAKAWHLCAEWPPWINSNGGVWSDKEWIWEVQRLGWWKIQTDKRRRAKKAEYRRGAFTSDTIWNTGDASSLLTQSVLWLLQLEPRCQSHVNVIKAGGRQPWKIHFASSHLQVNPMCKSSIEGKVRVGLWSSAQRPALRQTCLLYVWR